MRAGDDGEGTATAERTAQVSRRDAQVGGEVVERGLVQGYLAGDRVEADVGGLQRRLIVPLRLRRQTADQRASGGQRDSEHSVNCCAISAPVC